VSKLHFACENLTMYRNHSYACLNHTPACRNDIRACQNHTAWKSHSACGNRTLRREITLVRACWNHTFRSEITLVCEHHTMRVLITNCFENWVFLAKIYLKIYNAKISPVVIFGSDDDGCYAITTGIFRSIQQLLVWKWLNVPFPSFSKINAQFYSLWTQEHQKKHIF
jgi:hypothetical protein